MKIFITGIQGFIGSHLKTHWVSQGHEVVGSSSNESISSSVRSIFKDTILEHDYFKGIDVLVHCAYNLKKGAFDYNINYTKNIYNSAKRDSVPIQIFISSYSASPKAESEYGKSKFQLESLFLDQIIVRPGLVIGNGGLFARIIHLVNRFFIIPMIGSGKNPLALISINDLTAALDFILKHKKKGVFNLFYNRKSSLKELIQVLSKIFQKKRLIFPIPIFILYFPLWIIELLKIPFPISLENLKGYKKNEEYSYESHLESLGIQEESLEKKIRKVLEDGKGSV